MPHRIRPVPRALLALLCALSASACIPGGAPGAGPGPESETLAPMAWDSASDPDSIAHWALRGCRRGSVNTRRDCIERALGSVIEPAGIGRAMGALDRIVARDVDMLRESHGLAHGLGIAAYRSPETVAATFAACPPTQISGCYHGVIQAYFLDMAARGGVGAAEINALCEPHRGKGPIFFQCTHGLGHGLMAMLDNHVPASLDRCDLITLPVARDSCYGGVFMENIVAATHPEHTAHSHAAIAGSRRPAGEHAGHEAAGGHGHAEGDHGGHSPDSAAARPPWKALDAEDPLYPCTIVAEKYHRQCYLIQTAAILPRNGGDFAATARECTRAPESHVSTCWTSLGRDITAYAVRDPAKTAELCARVGAAAEPDCVRGAAATLVDTSSDPADGFAFCRVVAGAANKAACYRRVGDTLAGLFRDHARREEMCAAVEADHVDACRRGAGLAPPEQPRAAGATR
ncbi:MAG TPA: hypothetical protein VFR81_21420 [Longimicrobium sp.]|nr:hypothetical protein [Longimicrobium sp.]